MRKKDLTELVKEVIKELSATGTGANFTPGTGAQYATPYAFSKNKKDNRATKYIKKLGYKQVSRPKRPSSTKLIDYLN